MATHNSLFAEKDVRRTDEWTRGLAAAAVVPQPLAVGGRRRRRHPSTALRCPTENLRFALEGREYRIEELPEQSETLWFVADRPDVLIDLEPRARGGREDHGRGRADDASALHADHAGHRRRPRPLRHQPRSGRARGRAGMTARAPLRVAMIGYGFMGAAHSVGWRQAPRMFDLPAAVEMAVIVGRNADAVASAAEQVGLGRVGDRLARGHRARRHRHRRHRHPGRLARRDRDRGARGRQARARARSRSPTPSPRPRRWRMPPPRAAARGIRSMVGFTYRRVPAVTFLRDLIARGRRRKGPAGARRVPAGLARRPRDAAGVAPAEGARRFGCARRHRRAHHRHDAVRDRSERGCGLGHDRDDREGAAPAGRRAPGSVGHRRRGLRRGHRRRRRDLHRDGWRTARSSRSRRRASPPVARTRSRSRCRATRARSRSTSKTSTACSSTTARRRPTGRASRKILVTEAQHPYVAAWWPAGHMLGYEHGFSHQVVDLVDRDRGGHRPASVVRRGSVGAARARRRRAHRAQNDSAWVRIAAGVSGIRLNEPTRRRARWRVRSPCSPASGPTCRSKRSPASPGEWGYDGLEIACWGDHLDVSRWDDADYVQSRLDILETQRSEGLDDLEPPDRPGRLRRPDRRAAPRHPVRPRVGRR